MRFIGKKRAAGYLVLRVMHQDSTGWLVPEKPGLKIAQCVADYVGNHAQGYIEAIIRSELS